MNVKDILINLETKHPGEKEYLQAVHEVLESIQTIYDENPQYEAAKIIERLV
ncbi:MAG: glutamate dehydrogenase, partial [Gillisia sp.]|nr:glutamate dehydrogenase [Gillisia sp.]